MFLYFSIHGMDNYTHKGRAHLKSMKVSLSLGERSLYISIDKWVRVWIVVPHLWSACERPEKENSFSVLFGGACCHKASAKFLVGTSGCSCVCQCGKIFYGALKKHFLKRKRIIRSFFFTEEWNGILKWGNCIWLLYFHSKGKPKSL